MCSPCALRKIQHPAPAPATINVDVDDGDVKGDEEEEEVVFLGATAPQQTPTQPTGAAALRLVKLRNPWGKKEFSGDFGVGSEVWTKKLRKLLNYDTYNDARGEFWMPFDLFVKKFSSVDVCKVHDDWAPLDCNDNCFFASPCTSGSSSPSPFAPPAYSHVISPLQEGVWGYAICVQPKRRNASNATKPHVDANLLLLRRPEKGGAVEVRGGFGVIHRAQGLSSTGRHEAFSVD
jgi:hypothetical protein